MRSAGEAAALLEGGLPPAGPRAAPPPASSRRARRPDARARDEARTPSSASSASAPPDRPPLAALWLALAAPDPPHEHQLLRGLLGRALVEPLLPEDEEPLAVAVWADPNDRAALDAYERHLRAAGAVARADRVRRYADGR
ncbi:MAG: hypothetical protein KF878_10190 [Planctomycetes bacterium]|nr:hypothetical protein [Planctomycetota bacterium]